MRSIKALNVKIGGLLLAALLAASTVWALPDDFKKQIVVDAKRQQVDIKNQRVTFSGQVEVRQGTLKMSSDRLIVQGKGNEVMIAVGKPATFSQMLEANRPVEARANEIRYEVRSRTLTLSGDAELRQLDSVVTGNTIQYNIEKQQLLAEGGQDPEGRVTTIFMPEQIESLEQKQ